MSSSEAQEDCLELVLDVLKEVDLEQYFTRISKDLHITKLSHFHYVKAPDLIQIGLSRPAIRRLFAAVKRKQATLKSPGIISGMMNLVLPKQPKENVSRGKPTSPSSSRNEQNTRTTSLPRFEHMGASCLIDSKDITLKEKLGRGTFGEVMKGEWKHADGHTTDVAVKLLRTEAALPGALVDFVREVEAMIDLNHPNLIQLYGISLASPYMIIQELAPLGSVLDRLRKDCSQTSIGLIFSWSQQICYGMEFLEKKRKVHRDLAARNVMLASIDKIKIGDFGLTKSIEPDEECYTMKEQKKIPFPWCAPECLKWKQFSHASDCWAYGVTLWELFTFGEHPWVGCNGAQILQHIDQEGKRLPKPKACLAEIYQVMLQCWSHRQQDRPSFEALAKYFRDARLDTLRAVRSLDEPDKLELQAGDEVFVIDGRLDNHWWTGQNKRTLLIGQFPRKDMTDAGNRRTHHISNPLRHSFVHAAHGDMDPAKTFGNPGAIDDIFLRNPIPPLDLLGHNAQTPENTPPPIDLKCFAIPKPPGKSRSESVSGPSSPPSSLIDFAETSPTGDGRRKGFSRTNSHSESDLAYFENHQPSTLYSNDVLNLNQPSVSGTYFNLPPAGVPYPSFDVFPSAPSGYDLGLYSSIRSSAPTPVLPQSTPLLPMKPAPGTFPSVNYGMLGGYSDVVIPTGSPRFTTHSYCNTATSLYRPAPAPPGMTTPSAMFTPNTRGPPPPHITALIPQTVNLPPSRAEPVSNFFFKSEDLIKTEPIPSLDDPFDTAHLVKSKRLPETTPEPIYSVVPKPAARIPPFNVAPQTGEISGPSSLGSFGGEKLGAASSVLDDMVRKVQETFPGECASACQTALQKSRFDVKKAVNLLKVQRLLRLAIAPEEACEKVLEKCDWDVERAGEELLLQSNSCG